jgi:hypothetical protein
VPICSYHSKCDNTCVLETSVGWPPIRWKSYVAYYMIKKVFLRNFEMQLVSGDISYIGLTPNHVLDRVIDGVLKSDDTQENFVRYYKRMSTGA